MCSTAMKSVTDSLVLESLLHKDVAGRCKSVLREIAFCDALQVWLNFLIYRVPTGSFQ